MAKQDSRPDRRIVLGRAGQDAGMEARRRRERRARPRQLRSPPAPA